MKYIESVTFDEVLCQFLNGHFGQSIYQQYSTLRSKRPDFLFNPDLYNWEQNMIRRGALSLCAGDGCPLTSLLLKYSPKCDWSTDLKFARYSLELEDFMNLREINYDKKLYKAIKKYKKDEKTLNLIQDIRDGVFDFRELDGIIAYKIDSEYTIIDGVHRAMAIMIEINNNNLQFPSISIICLENEIKEEFIFFKRRFVCQPV